MRAERATLPRRMRSSMPETKILNRKEREGIRKGR
jgi:hypothetical protein